MTTSYNRREALSLLSLALLAPPANTLGLQSEASAVSSRPWHALPAMLAQSTATAVQFDSLMESVGRDPRKWIISPASRLWFAKAWHEARGQDLAALCRQKRIAAFCELDCQRRPEARGPGDYFVELIVYDTLASAEDDWVTTKERLFENGGRRSGDDFILVPQGEAIASPKAFTRVQNAIMCVCEPFSSLPNPVAFLDPASKVIVGFLAVA